MDFRELKRQTDKIRMSDEMETRLIIKCRVRYAAEREDNMKKIGFKKPAFALIAVVICLCLAIGVGAAVSGGTFKDITNWSGAVVGTEYLNATDEIIMDAKAENGVLTLSVEFKNADEAPYSEIEELGVAAYTITNKNGDEQDKANFTITDKYGNVLKAGEMEMVPIENGCAEFEISLSELSKGEYVLEIDSFVGGKKADQPLPIKGSWTAEFTV